MKDTIRTKTETISQNICCLRTVQ